MATRLLIVDDDAELTRLLTELLGQEGFEVDTSAGGPIPPFGQRRVDTRS